MRKNLEVEAVLMNLHSKVKIGVAVIPLKNNNVLLGLRTGSHGANTWAFPGGHLNSKETLEECANRELKEETGLIPNSLVYLTYTIDYFEECNTVYLTIFIQAEIAEQYEQQLLEPHKCLEWQWFPSNKFPAPLFLSVVNLIHKGFYPQKKYLSI